MCILHHYKNICPNILANQMFSKSIIGIVEKVHKSCKENLFGFRVLKHSPFDLEFIYQWPAQECLPSSYGSALSRSKLKIGFSTMNQPCIRELVIT